MSINLLTVRSRGQRSQLHTDICEDRDDAPAAKHNLVTLVTLVTLVPILDQGIITMVSTRNSLIMFITRAGGAANLITLVFNGSHRNMVLVKMCGIWT